MWLAACGVAPAEVLWPQFRGPLGQGYAQAEGEPVVKFPTEWSETKNVKWKTPISGKGWSTPVIGEKMIWATTAAPDGKEYFALGIDRESGKMLHELNLFHCEKPEPLGNDVNGYASPSSLLSGGRVFVHFGSYGTACLDELTGKEIWRRTDLPCRHYRGPGSSLAEWGDFLILSMDGVDVQYLTALDKKTGKTVWKTDRTTDFKDLQADGKPKMEGDMRKAYTTPIFISWPDGPTQMVSTGARSTFAYDPKTGKELWAYKYDGFSNASSPVQGNNAIYINTGYGKANLVALRTDIKAAGDITGTHHVWTCNKRVPQRSSPIAVGRTVYMVDDSGMCSAVSMETGEISWSERLDGKHSGTPIYAGGLLYFCGELGSTFILKPDPATFTKVAENKLDAGMLASPAAAGKALYLRTKTHLYRIEE